MGKRKKNIPAEQYVEDVLKNNIVVCKWVKLACKRHRHDRNNENKLNFYFDEKAGNEIIFFFHKFLHHSKGEWAGQVFELEPWEQFILWCLFGWKRKEDDQRRFRTAYLEVARKNGKALDSNTIVPTIEGFKQIRDIKIGDKIFDDNGKICNVIAESALFYDHDCYEVEFSTGEKFIADADHLWFTKAHINIPGSHENKIKRDIQRFKPPKLKLRTIHNRKYWYADLYAKQVYLGRYGKSVSKKYKKLAQEDLKKYPIRLNNFERIRTTEEIFNTQIYGCRQDANHSIKIAKSLDLPSRNFSIPPYVLGIWLGDGNSDGAQITCSIEDKEIIESINFYGINTRLVRRNENGSKAYVYRLSFLDNDLCCRNHDPLERNDKGRCLACNREVDYAKRHNLSQPKRINITFQETLRKLNLLKNKHIPIEYLRGSIDQRFQLLCGLMDSDGTITKQGQCCFDNTNQKLSNDVFHLVSSLGFKPSMKIRQAKLNGKYCGDYFEIQFWAYKDTPIFKLKRKLIRQKNEPKKITRTQTRQIVSVKKVESRPTKCITVNSSSGLFLIGESCVPTHNSTLLAGIGLYLFMGDREPGAEIYTAAVKRDQAIITHAEATRMVKKSNDLRKAVTIFKNNISIENTACKFEPLGKDSDSCDGLNVHGALVDELHAHKTRDMWDVLETATGSRRQPLQIAITTAGFDRESICWEQHEYSEKLLKGTIKDDTYFSIIYTIDENDDWKDESIWIKANPNLGISVKLDDLQRKANKAKQISSAVNNFLRKHLDVWVQQSTRWIDIDLWDQNYSHDVNENELMGNMCYGGLDLSSVSDLTAWVLIFPDDADSEMIDVLCRFWCPEARLTDTHNRYRHQYEAWHRDGWLNVTSGDAIDYDDVYAQVLLDTTKNFNLKSMSIDRLFQGYQLAMNLSKEIDGNLEIKENDKKRKVGTMGMGFLSMAGPMKELETRLLKRKINHGNNPIMRYMADSLAVQEDAAGNKKPDKAKSQGKIDGIIGLLMALDRSIRERNISSKYENEGLSSL